MQILLLKDMDIISVKSILEKIMVFSSIKEQVKKIKEENPNKIIIMCGCMPQQKEGK